MSVMKAAGYPVVVRVDYPVAQELASWIAAYMIAAGEPLTVGRLREHARHAYGSEGGMVDVDVEQWCEAHWPHAKEPGDDAHLQADLWIMKIAAGGNR